MSARKRYDVSVSPVSSLTSRSKSGKNGRLMIDAPREMNISRSNNDPNPEKRKDTYYPEPKISEEAQHEIKKIIWNERQKKAKSETDKKA